MKNLHAFRLWANTCVRPYILCFALLVLSSSLLAQNVAINATGNQADPSAMLDVSSQTAGVLIPRMSTSARNAISSPATGLQIFNTDCNELNYWNGTCWISTGSLPAPGPLTSNSATILCALSTATYSIPAITGATQYIWSVPAGAAINSGQGTTSINVTWGNISGDVCVTAYDACESSEQRCMGISINPIPPTPGNITGLTSVSPGQTNVSYFIASVSGASSYTWTVPSGATIASGTGTPVITVNFPCNAVGGNVTVTAGSNCGTSTASGLAITVTPYLSAHSGSGVFGGTAIGGSPTASGGWSPYNYSWNPASNLSSSTVANPTAQCSGSTTTYTVTVTDAGGCTATSSGVVVTRNLSANAGSAVFGGSVIGGSPVASGGAAPYTYSWSPNTNLSSAIVANPTALCNGSTTTYTVTINDANGCTATSSVVVTRNLAASAGSAVFGGALIGGNPTATGGLSPYTYLWSPSSNVSNSTNSNPTALCSGSTTTYAITVNDANGCTATGSVVVTRNITANAGSAVFGGAAIGGSPTATGGQAPYTYSWSPNSNLLSYTVANPTAQCSGSTTTYTLTLNDANGCTATSSAAVTRNLTANAGSAVLGGIAIGGSPTAAGGQAPYTYSWGPNNNLSNSAASNPTALCSGSTTTYTVTVSDANGCTATSSVVVTRSLAASAGPNVSGICASGSSIGGSPTASGGNSNSYTYAWLPTTNLSSPTIANPTASASSSTVYTVTVTDANGCAATSSMTFNPGATTNTTYTYTGTSTTWTVPSGITCVSINAYGAQGAGSGGEGGQALGILSVTSGTVLNIYVGGTGSGSTGGYNGGGNDNGSGYGGGGASDVRVGGTALSNRVIVGAGGGGTTNGEQQCGGTGGGLTGGTSCNSGGGAAGGGTQSAGGTAGSGNNSSQNGNPGSLGFGGNTSTGSGYTSYGGGGGGGYYGGGGGGSNNAGNTNYSSGGGGGSSYIGGVSNGTTNTGVQTGNGQIIISY